jgi:hypothetical protein
MRSAAYIFSHHKSYEKGKVSMHKKTLFLIVFMAMALGLASPYANAQTATPTVFASGLKAPTKIIVSPKGNLLVAEQGNGPNTGRVSVLDSGGNRRTLIDGLPSGFSPPNGEPSGPSGLEMRGRTLYVVIGLGDATVSGPVPGTEIPNPSPSSPFLSSVLSVRLSPKAEETTPGFTLTAADQQSLQSRGFAKLTDTSGNELTVEVLANFPDFTFEARPNFAGNVRPSNPFGITSRGNSLYVVDASQNQIYEVDVDSGNYRIAYRIPLRQNPLPIGPPVIDPVPDSIRLFGKSLLVTVLTGFPFPAGTAEVRKIRLANGANEPFISGLSSAIDVLPAKNSNGQDIFFTLEFSTAQLMNAPGRLTLFDQLGGNPVVLLNTLTSPTSMVQDPASGDLFVTEIFPGTITRVKLP